MKKKVCVLLAAMTLLCLPLLAMAQPPTLSDPGSGKAVSQVMAAVPLKSFPVLWDQPVSTANSSAYASQDFDQPNNNYDIFLADDFTNTETWNIVSIHTPGEFWNNPTTPTLANVTSLNWQIYPDATGFPSGNPWDNGTTPVWSISVSPDDTRVNITQGGYGYPSVATLTLSTPITLPPGTYWLVYYPTMSYYVVGQYGRYVSDTTNGAIGKVINPGGGFGIGTTWADITTALGSAQQDLAFRLEGVTGDMSMNLTSPEAGEVLATGSDYHIRWTAPPEAVTFRVKVSMDGGKTWKVLADQYGERYLDWHVPVVPGNKPKCLVSVEGFDENGKFIASDRSEANFGLEVVRLTTPNGSETLHSAETPSISWVTNDTKGVVKKVQLSYTKDGKTWSPITTLNDNPGTYAWTVPAVTADKTKCKVKLVLKDATGKTVGSDVSDNFFTISPTP